MRRFGTAAVIACMLAACAARNPQPWIEDGQRQGNVFTDQLPDGRFNRRYVNLQSQLVRLDRYKSEGQPMPGAWRSTFQYENGKRVRRDEWSVDDTRTSNERGFATIQFTYEPDRRQCRFFDASGSPVERVDGVHQIANRYRAERLEQIDFLNLLDAPVDSESGARQLYSYRDDKLIEVRLVDVASRPSKGLYRGMQSSTIRYEYIKGVKGIPVVAEHLLGIDGGTISTRFYTQAPSEFDACF